jgi:hypothetical protein
MRKLLASAALALILLTVSIGGQSDWSESGTVERDFSSGGLIRLDLSAGDYTVEGTNANRIRVKWYTKTADEAGDVKIDAEIRGSEANITTYGPNNHFRVEIAVPQRSDLYLRMSAGDLAVVGIEGDKDVRLRAGDLSIDVGDPASYKLVTGSVTAGDIDASPFGINKGGLFRSFTHEGSGRFSLRARLWAGDMRFFTEERKALKF